MKKSELYTGIVLKTKDDYYMVVKCLGNGEDQLITRDGFNPLRYYDENLIYKSPGTDFEITDILIPDGSWSFYKFFQGNLEDYKSVSKKGSEVLRLQNTVTELVKQMEKLREALLNMKEDLS